MEFTRYFPSARKFFLRWHTPHRERETPTLPPSKKSARFSLPLKGARGHVWSAALTLATQRCKGESCSRLCASHPASSRSRSSLHKLATLELIHSLEDMEKSEEGQEQVRYQKKTERTKTKRHTHWNTGKRFPPLPGARPRPRSTANWATRARFHDFRSQSQSLI